MTKPQREVDVQRIKAEVDTPQTRAAKLNSLDSNEFSASITGSGDTGTLVTNNSQKDWFLEHVSVAVASTAVSSTTVQVDMHLEDGNDELLAGQVCNPPWGTPVDFGGVKFPPGAHLDYAITQTDAESYDVMFHPFIRRDPTAASAGVDPVTPDLTTIENWETSSPITSRWSNDTGDWSTTTTAGEVFDGSTAAKSSNANADILADSSLVNVPDPSEDTWNIHMAGSVGQSASAKCFGYVFFGVQDTSGFDPDTDDAYQYVLQVEFNNGELRLRKVDDSGNTVASDRNSPYIDYKADRFYRLKYRPTDTGPAVQAFDTVTGDEVGSVSIADDPMLSGGDFWLSVETDGSESVIVDDAYIVA